MASADGRATDRTCLESAPTAVSRLIRVGAYFYCLRSRASHTTRLRGSRGVNYGVIRFGTLVFRHSKVIRNSLESYCSRD